MATITRKGDHRKVRELPVGELTTIGLLLLACVGLLAMLFVVTAPQANAGTVSYLRPAVTAVKDDAVKAFTSYLDVAGAGASMGINPAAIAAPAAGQVGRERIAAATPDRNS